MYEKPNGDYVKTYFFLIQICMTKIYEKITPEALKSLYCSPGNKKNQLVLCKNYVLQW